MESKTLIMNQEGQIDRVMKNFLRIYQKINNSHNYHLHPSDQDNLDSNNNSNKNNINQEIKIFQKKCKAFYYIY